MACQSLGLELAIILDATENAAAMASLPAKGAPGHVWIGLHDTQVENVWTWLPNNIPGDYTNWGKGEPNQWVDGNEDHNCPHNCTVMKTWDGEWNDQPCTYERAYVCKNLCPTPPLPPSPPSAPASGPVSLHGDPMFNHNGKGQHFWLKENVSVPLLLWEHDGHKMRLNGVTFANAETGHQWFKEISLISDGGRAFGVHVSSKSDKLSLLSDVNGTLMRAGIFDLEVTSKGTKNNPESVTTIRAGGMKFALMAARAHKFADPEDQQKYAHVNLKMPEGLATGATGLLAELAGTQPMSVATKVLLRSPSSK